jgi:Ca2+-binding RTX toxin-like protein
VRASARLALAGAAFLAASAAAVPATAAACAYDAATATVMVTVGEAEAVTIGRLGEDIALDGASCGGTVQNTDTVTIAATGQPTSITIDLGAGPFAPGATPESDGGASEIEFIADFPGGPPLMVVAGAPGNDAITVGRDGINLDATEAVGDADVPVGDAPVEVGGGDGDDVLSVAGGAGTGAPKEATLRGGPGADLLLGGAGGSSLEGGDGADTLDYSAATVPLMADLGAGTVEVGPAADAISETENLTGSPGDDEIVGDGGDNVLRGGDGEDTIDGAAGADTLSGGVGIDRVVFAGADEVDVDLRVGSASGAGEDTLGEFENVVGSSGGDTIHGSGAGNVLSGGGGDDRVFGHGGRDTVRGAGGADELFGQVGDDVVQGGAGKDMLNGGKGNDDVCKGGPDPDSFVACEQIVTGPPSAEGS